MFKGINIAGVQFRKKASRHDFFDRFGLRSTQRTIASIAQFALFFEPFRTLQNPTNFQHQRRSSIKTMQI